MNKLCIVMPSLLSSLASDFLIIRSFSLLEGICSCSVMVIMVLFQSTDPGSIPGNCKFKFILMFLLSWIEFNFILTYRALNEFFVKIK